MLLASTNFKDSTKPSNVPFVYKNDYHVCTLFQYFNMANMCLSLRNLYLIDDGSHEDYLNKVIMFLYNY